MLTASFLRGIETQLGKKLKQKLHFKRVQPVSGGSINHAARLDTSWGIYFLKANDSFQYPQMFEKEARGLAALKNTGLITIPDVIFTGEEDGLSFIILRFIESKSKVNDFWEKFGVELAQIHRHTSPYFGYEEDNYIGSLVQCNNKHNKWTDFFIEERLEKQLSLAIQNGRMNTADINIFKNIYLKIESLFPEEAPSLLHGDLWSGNFITGNSGEPCLIDPAVYYGHREMDLAMTKLFGGFDETFYHAYQSEFPIEPGHDERVDLCNLYPLMVHVNLFDGGYLSQVKSILKRFS
jgi:protein-ribulosamine 3-kinase